MNEIPPVEYTSPLPECRVTATADPHAMVRLDVSRKRGIILAKRVRETVKSHDGDGLLDILFHMNRRAYTHMAENLGQLLEPDADGVQVVVDSEPDISIMVILNQSQIQKLDRTSSRALKRSGDAFAWKVSVSENGADMLVEQLIMAANGEENPVEALREQMDGDADE